MAGIHRQECHQTWMRPESVNIWQVTPCSCETEFYQHDL